MRVLKIISKRALERERGNGPCNREFVVSGRNREKLCRGNRTGKWSVEDTGSERCQGARSCYILRS